MLKNSKFDYFKTIVATIGSIIMIENFLKKEKRHTLIAYPPKMPYRAILTAKKARANTRTHERNCKIF